MKSWGSFGSDQILAQFEQILEQKDARMLDEGGGFCRFSPQMQRVLQITLWIYEAPRDVAEGGSQEDWRLEIGDWKLKVGSWKLEIGNRKRKIEVFQGDVVNAGNFTRFGDGCGLTGADRGKRGGKQQQRESSHSQHLGSQGLWRRPTADCSGSSCCALTRNHTSFVQRNPGNSIGSRIGEDPVKIQ